MLEWLLGRQPRIEGSLTYRHLKGGNTLILHGVLSSYLEGRYCHVTIEQRMQFADNMLEVEASSTRTQHSFRN